MCCSIAVHWIFNSIYSTLDVTTSYQQSFYSFGMNMFYTQLNVFKLLYSIFKLKIQDWSFYINFSMVFFSFINQDKERTYLVYIDPIKVLLCYKSRIYDLNYLRLRKLQQFVLYLRHSLPSSNITVLVETFVLTYHMSKHFIS